MAAGSQMWKQSLAQLSQDLLLCGPRWQPWGGVSEGFRKVLQTAVDCTEPQAERTSVSRERVSEGLPCPVPVLDQPVPPPAPGPESHTHLASVQGPSSHLTLVVWPLRS